MIADLLKPFIIDKVDNQRTDFDPAFTGINIGFSKEINQAQLGIQARAIAIAQLSDQIGDKVVVLQILEERLKKQQQSLADLVRKSATLDDFSLVEVMLSKKSFSEFFSECHFH